VTRNEIDRMAREAGFEFNSLGATYTSGWLPDLLARFANLVAKAEREKCAKQLDALGCDHCAAAIRARATKTQA
jgi:hypothetical protein